MEGEERKWWKQEIKSGSDHLREDGNVHNRRISSKCIVRVTVLRKKTLSGNKWRRTKEEKKEEDSVEERDKRGVKLGTTGIDRSGRSTASCKRMDQERKSSSLFCSHSLSPLSLFILYSFLFSSFSSPHHLFVLKGRHLEEKREGGKKDEKREGGKKKDERRKEESGSHMG